MTEQEFNDGARVLRVTDDEGSHLTTRAAFARDNADCQHVAAIASELQPGQRIACGGGASPVVVIEAHPFPEDAPSFHRPQCGDCNGAGCPDCTHGELAPTVRP